MRSVIPILIILAAGVLPACGGGRAVTAAGPALVSSRSATLGAQPIASEAYDPADAINHEGFSLFVLDEEGKIAPELRKYYDFTVHILQNDDAFISIFAHNLPASASSLFVLKYNPHEWSVRQSKMGRFYGGEGNSIFLAVDRFAGTLPIGIARIRPQEYGLMEGNGLLAEIAMSPHPAGEPRQVAATATESSLVFENFTIENNGSANVLSWEDHIKADYNNDGVVSISDITPLAVYFGGEVGDGVNDQQEAWVDGNGDTIVNIMDITPLAAYFGHVINGYFIYRRVEGIPDSEKQLPNLHAPSPITIFRPHANPYTPAHYTYADASYIDDLPAEGGTFVYRVVAAGDTEGGPEFSESVTVGVGADTLPPHGPEGPAFPFKGVKAISKGNGRLKVDYALDASDAQPTGEFTPRSEIRYFLYLGFPDASTGINLNTLIADPIEITGVDSPYIWDDLDFDAAGKQQLINGTQYAVYIAAEDNAGNRTSPSLGTVKTGTPSATSRNDFEPPIWQGPPGITDAVAGDGGVRITFSSAVDAASPPVHYRLYYSEQIPFNLLSATQVDVPNSPFSLNGLQNGTQYGLLLRALDSADQYDPPVEANETTNSAVTYITPQPGTDVTPPVWLDTVGIQQLVPGDASIRLEFGEATDADSPPVSYRVYYQQGTDVLFDENTASVSFDSNFPPPYLTGLTNDQEYAVVVRAYDAAGNEEKNMETLAATPAAGLDNLPPTWDTTVGVQGLLPGNGHMDIWWNSATDADSPPVSYRVYWEQGDQGITDYELAVSENRYLDTDQLLCQVEPLENDLTYSFAVRARDSAPTPNEDYNLVFLAGAPTAGPEFIPELVDDPSDPVMFTSIAVDSQGHIGVAYTTGQEIAAGQFRYSLHYATDESGSWETEDVGPPMASLGAMPSLKFDHSDVPHIAAIDNTNEYREPPETPYTVVEMAVRQSPGVWTLDTVDDGANETIFVYPSLAFNENGKPAVAYISESSASAGKDFKLWYAINPGGGWNRQMLPGVSAGGHLARLGYNCALEFGVFNVEDVVRERATIAFTDPDDLDHLKWAVEGESNPWEILIVDDSAPMRFVDLTIWREDLGGGQFTDWPRISYRFDTGNAMYAAIMRYDNVNEQLYWDLRQVDWQEAPGCGYYTNIAVAQELSPEFQLVFVVGRSEFLHRARLGIEDLVTGDFMVQDIPPFGSVDSGTELSMALKRVLSSDKVVFSMISDSNLYVTIQQ